jgi:hypothetical protein
VQLAPASDSCPPLAAVAGQGSLPFATEKASSNSRAASRRRRVSSKLRCSVCAESVYMAVASSRLTMVNTTASSVSVKPC